MVGFKPMFTINIVQVGKMKKGPLAELAHELHKRLPPYARVQLRTVKELTGAESWWGNDSLKILLSEKGKTTDSIAFAQALTTWSDHGQRAVTFVVAGPHGFSPAVLKHADHLLSLSQMTFTHEMAYVILLEQLYRAGTILAGKTYHY